MTSPSENPELAASGQWEGILAGLLDSLRSVIWCTTIGGDKLLYLNSAAEQLYGRPFQDLLADRDYWKHAIHPDDRDVVLDLVSRLHETGRIDQEYRIVRPDGSLRWIRDRITLVYDEASRPVRMGGMATDITERRATTEALRQSEAVYHSLVESLPLNALRKDLDGRFVFANQSCLQALNTTLDDLKGKTDFDLFPRELAEKYREDDSRVQRTLRVVHEVEEHQAANNETIHVEVIKGPVRDRSGELVGIQALFWDVTEKYRAEEQQKRQALEARLLHQATRLAAETDSLTDALQGVVDIVCELTGWPVGHAWLAADRPESESAQLVSASIWHLDDPEKYRVFRDVTKLATFEPGVGMVGRIWQTAEPVWIKNVTLADTFLRASSDEIVVRGAFGFPVMVRGEPVGVLEFFTSEEAERDENLLRIARILGEQVGRVIERKRAEEALRAARDAAEAASSAKSDFLANMSHEIRTPMNAVLGMAELLQDTRLTDSQRQYIDMIRDSGETLLSLINGILDFSRIEAGKLELESAPFQLHDLLADTVRFLIPRADRKELELALEIAPDTPDHVLGDAVRLRQIVINLVGNAIKFTEQGEVVVRANAIGGEGDSVILNCSVRDTGIGISAEKLDRIFHAFEQADMSTTREFGGSGLGLAIVSRLVGLMGGEVTVESVHGRGSEFRFSIVLQQADGPAGELPTASLEQLQQKSVLIVDDNATNRTILTEMVRSRGLAPVEAAGAVDALRLLHVRRAESCPVELVLTDLNMPDVDGFGLVEQIYRQTDRDERPVVIMLTSSDRPGNHDRCERLGVAACLLKPVKQSELFRSIARAFSLPVGASADDDRKRDSAAEQRPLRVLLAEDVIANQMVVTGLLSKWNHSVTVVSNGRDAVDHLASDEFDLVLMDIQMPVMDGLTATAEIRKREQSGELKHLSAERIPIVAMTAHAMKGDRDRCLDAGMDDYISKPIRSAELGAIIARLCGTCPAPPTAADDSLAVAESADSPKSETTSAGDGHVVNWDAALEQVLGDRELLRNVARAFLSECEPLRGELRDAVAEADAEEIRRVTHKLNGGLRTFCEDRAEQLIAALKPDDDGRMNDRLDQHLATLDGFLDEMVAELNAFCDGLD